MGGSVPSVGLEEFKRMTKEFFDALKTATLEEAEAGMKCIGLTYLNLKLEHEWESVGAVATLRIISRIYFDFQLNHLDDPIAQ